LTIGEEYDLFKRLILNQTSISTQEEFYEEDVSTEQFKKEEDAWLLRKDEYPGGRNVLKRRRMKGRKKLSV